MSNDNRAVIDLLKAQVEIDGATITANADFDRVGFEALAPNNCKKLDAVVTYDQAKAVDATRKEQAGVSITAIAELCQDQLVTNESLDFVIGTAKLGNTTIKSTVHRELEVAAGIAKNKGDVVATRVVIGRLLNSVKTSFGTSVSKTVAAIEERSKEVGLKAKPKD